MHVYTHSNLLPPKKHVQPGCSDAGPETAVTATCDQEAWTWSFFNFGGTDEG